MIDRHGLAFKLSLLIVAGGMLVLTLMSGYSYRFSRRTLERNIEDSARNLTLSTVNRVQAVLAATEKIPATLADALEQTDYDAETVARLLRAALERNPEMYGTTAAFEPYAFDPSAEYFAPYFFRRDGVIQATQLGNPKYHYFSMDWYQTPSAAGAPLWSQPYFDEGGGETLMTTYSVPFYDRRDGARRLRGVITADLSLDWLKAIVSSVHISTSGYAFLISKTGVIVTHPQRQLVLHETIFSLAAARGEAGLRDIGRAMVAGESGFVPTSCLTSQGRCWMAYAPVPASGWSLGALFPQDELMADVEQLNRVVLALGAAGALFLLLVVVAVARSITRPLAALAAASDEIARGRLDGALPAVHSRDEVGRLTAAFARMQHELKQYISDLQATSEARERAAQEALALAAECKRAEERIAEYSRTLEHKVDERTHELRDKNDALETTLEQLRAMQQQLVTQEKLASLGALTAGIAHEIKNPLNFVNNFAELSTELTAELGQALAAPLAQVAPAERQYIEDILADLRQNVAKINQHGKRADSIVHGMLQHSRGASGQPEPVDLNALLAEYVALAYHGLRAQDSTFNVALNSDYDPAVGGVAVVREDLGRVILNIVNNACYAADQKRRRLGEAFAPEVRITTTRLGDGVEIRIRDNGDGMPPAVCEKIFNPFFTTKPAGVGTGLGLSISHDIVVQQHRGELRVESQEGQYAEFIIVLPATAPRRGAVLSPAEPL